MSNPAYKAWQANKDEILELRDAAEMELAVRGFQKMVERVCNPMVWRCSGWEVSFTCRMPMLLGVTGERRHFELTVTVTHDSILQKREVLRPRSLRGFKQGLKSMMRMAIDWTQIDKQLPPRNTVTVTLGYDDAQALRASLETQMAVNRSRILADRQTLRFEDRVIAALSDAGVAPQQASTP